MVFHEHSSQTHFLNLLALRILERLEREVCAVDDIIADFVGEFAAEETPELREAIVQTLTVLDQLGLITNA